MTKESGTIDHQILVFKVSTVMPSIGGKKKVAKNVLPNRLVPLGKNLEKALYGGDTFIQLVTKCQCYNGY